MHRCKWLKGVEKNRGEKKGRKTGKEKWVEETKQMGRNIKEKEKNACMF